jgi:hypothetical protein
VLLSQSAHFVPFWYGSDRRTLFFLYRWSVTELFQLATYGRVFLLNSTIANASINQSRGKSAMTKDSSDVFKGHASVDS